MWMIIFFLWNFKIQVLIIVTKRKWLKMLITDNNQHWNHIVFFFLYHLTTKLSIEIQKILLFGQEVREIGRKTKMWILDTTEQKVITFKTNVVFCTRNKHIEVRVAHIKTYKLIETFFWIRMLCIRPSLLSKNHLPIKCLAYSQKPSQL